MAKKKNVKKKAKGPSKPNRAALRPGSTGKASRKSPAKTKAAAKKTVAKVKSPKKPAVRKARTKTKAVVRKVRAKTKSTSGKRRARKAVTGSAMRPPRGGRVDADALALEESSYASSEVLSGDLQGLSHEALADSESVDELVEEGNAFEADVVAGVENADNADEREVHTHEVPEDDVPREYLDEE